MEQKRKNTGGMQMILRGRLAFVNAFKPRAAQPGAPLKYGVTIMVPKKDPQVKLIRDAISKVADAKWGPGSSKKLGVQNGIRMILRDGEERVADWPEFKGMMFMAANSDRQPGIIDRHGQEVISPQGCYSGVEAQVQVNFYPTETGGRCVAAGLNNIRVLRLLDGFTGAQKPEDVDWGDTSDVDDEEETTAQGQEAADDLLS